MDRGRTFTTLPHRAISDSKLTALELRVLGAIARHDGMSLWPGKSGPGCFAKHSTLAAEVGVNAPSFSRALSELVAAGYIRREQHGADKRRQTLRVVPDCLHTGQQSLKPKVGGPDNNCSDILTEQANKVVTKGDLENRANPPILPPSYYSLGKNSSEDDEGNSVETARLDGAHHGTPGNYETWTILAKLPLGFPSMSVAGQLGAFERALKQIDHSTIDPVEARAAEGWLAVTMDEYCHDATIGPWAQRLFENLPWGVAA